MTKKYIFIILPFLVFLVFAGCNRKPVEKGFFRPHFGHPHKGEPKDVSGFLYSRIDKMAEDLGLSSGQLEELKNLEMEITRKQIEMRRNKDYKENIKGKIIEMVQKDSLSKEEILSFMNELHSLGEKCRMEMDSFVAERLAKMHSVLTKEQREKLAKKLEEFKPRRDFKPERDRK